VKLQRPEKTEKTSWSSQLWEPVIFYMAMGTCESDTAMGICDIRHVYGNLLYPTRLWEPAISDTGYENLLYSVRLWEPVISVTSMGTCDIRHGYWNLRYPTRLWDPAISATTMETCDIRHSYGNL
jgi:hypothetical protein